MHHTNDQVAGKLIRQIRRESGLKQIELARRSGIPSSVLSAYEHGHRQPAVAALARIAGAVGLQVRVGPVGGRVGTLSNEMQLIRAGKILAQVLDLAEQLPYEPRRQLAYPPLIHLAK
jgi:transcriptional regulator with XRE-family HTH domain